MWKLVETSLFPALTTSSRLFKFAVPLPATVSAGFGLLSFCSCNSSGLKCCVVCVESLLVKMLCHLFIEIKGFFTLPSGKGGGELLAFFLCYLANQRCAPNFR